MTQFSNIVLLKHQQFYSSFFCSMGASFNTARKTNNLLGLLLKYFSPFGSIKWVLETPRVVLTTLWEALLLGKCFKGTRVLACNSYSWILLVRCFKKEIHSERTGQFSSWVENNRESAKTWDEKLLEGQWLPGSEWTTRFSSVAQIRLKCGLSISNHNKCSN